MSSPEVAPWETHDPNEVAPWETPGPNASVLKANLLPSYSALEDANQSAGKKTGFVEGNLALAGDVLGIPTRAVATLRGEKMSDPNSYYWKPRIEQAKEFIDNHPAYVPEPFTPATLKGAVELAGRTLSDPLLLAGPVGDGIALAGRKVAGVSEKVAGAAKRGIESLSGIPQDILDRAASPQGAKELRDAAINSEGGNLYPMAEDLSQKVQGLNEGRQTLQQGSQDRQLTQFEENLSQALRRPGVLTATPSRGAEIPEIIAGAKGPMQEAFVAGDKAAVGPLRGKPATEEVTQVKTPIFGEPTPGTSTRPQIGEDITETRVRDVSKGLKGVLYEFKALKPEQGVPKITKGASGALKGILGMAEKQAATVDDLINLKGQLRSVRQGGSFEGNVFDASVDDLAFNKAEEVINRAVEKAIAKADPKNAGKIIQLMRANNAQYAKTKSILSDLSGSMGQIQNSDRVISKVAALGPKKSRDLVESANSIPALRPVVDELRQGFMDDLILSASKGGKIDPAAFAKRWNDARALSPELKSVWLNPEQIARIDEAVSTASVDVGKPGLLGEKIFGSAAKPSITAGARRLENIGANANRDAEKELSFLDNILGLKGEDSYLKRATDVFEGKQLGITKDGNLPVTPISKTGRSVLGTQLGDVLGGILGGGVGLATGGLTGAATGTVLGAGTKRGLQVGLGYAQSPAGAVAANRILNKWAIERAAGISERAGTLARALEKTKSPVIKARLVDQLHREIEKQGESE